MRFGRGITWFALIPLIASCQFSTPPNSATATSASQAFVDGGLDDPDQAVDADYVAPLSMQEFVKSTSQSVVMLACGRSYGTGWFIDTASPPIVRKGLEAALKGDEFSLLVTVAHVTERCAKDSRKRLRVFLNDVEVPGQLVNWNTKADIALISVPTKSPGLPVGKRPPQAAWVMAIGFPLYFDYPVTLVGSVIDSRGDDVVALMQIQPGNSGSPLLSSRGEVVATLKTAFMDPDDKTVVGWTLGNSTQVLCRFLFNCREVPITTRIEVKD